MTNYEKIKSMSEKEMAKFLNSISDWTDDETDFQLGIQIGFKRLFYDEIEEWLREEYEVSLGGM